MSLKPGVCVDIWDEGVIRAAMFVRDDGKTLTAITVAAHECGHALQHAGHEPMFMLRTRLATTSAVVPIAA